MKVGHVKVWHFNHERHKKVQNGDDRGVVVKTDHGIHLQALSIKHDLCHNNSHSLECKSTHLEDKANHRKLDHASACDCNAHSNNKNIGNLSDSWIHDTE